MADSKYQETLKELLKYDVGRSAYFDVRIHSKFGSSDDKIFTYLCHSAELPGESTATVTQKIYGVVEKFAIMSAYNDITLSFYTRGSDLDRVRKNILEWLSKITGRGEILGGYGQTTYNVAYKSRYTGKIEITHYSATGEVLTKCTLIDAFPLAINQTQLSWSAANEAISLDVTFAYTEYYYTFNLVSNTTDNSIPIKQQPTIIDSGLSKFTLSSPTSGTTQIG